MEQQQDYVTPLLSEFNTKLQDIEERQRLLKDRILLIGENLVESREESQREITDLKINVNQMLQDIKRIKETLSRIADELETKARTQEIEMLKKQAKMFQPLELARIEDVKKMIKEAR